MASSVARGGLPAAVCCARTCARGWCGGAGVPRLPSAAPLADSKSQAAALEEACALEALALEDGDPDAAKATTRQVAKNNLLCKKRTFIEQKKMDTRHKNTVGTEG